MNEQTHGQRFDPNFHRINNRSEDSLPKYDVAELEEIEEAQEAEEDG